MGGEDNLVAWHLNLVIYLCDESDVECQLFIKMELMKDKFQQLVFAFYSPPGTYQKYVVWNIGCRATNGLYYSATVTGVVQFQFIIAFNTGKECYFNVSIDILIDDPLASRT